MQSDKKTEPVVKEKVQSKKEYIKISQMQKLKKSVRAELLKGYKRHYFKNFEMNFPQKCEIRKEKSNLTSIRGTLAICLRAK